MTFINGHFRNDCWKNKFWPSELKLFEPFGISLAFYIMLKESYPLKLLPKSLETSFRYYQILNNFRLIGTRNKFFALYSRWLLLPQAPICRWCKANQNCFHISSRTVGSYISSKLRLYSLAPNSLNKQMNFQLFNSLFSHFYYLRPSRCGNFDFFWENALNLPTIWAKQL